MVIFVSLLRAPNPDLLNVITRLGCQHLLLVFAVVPVVSLMLAGQEVGPVVPLALHELQEVLGTVVPLLQRQLGQVHLILGGYHLWQRYTHFHGHLTIQAPDVTI